MNTQVTPSRARAGYLAVEQATAAPRGTYAEFRAAFRRLEEQGRIEVPQITTRARRALANRMAARRAALEEDET